MATTRLPKRPTPALAVSRLMWLLFFCAMLALMWELFRRVFGAEVASVCAAGFALFLAAIQLITKGDGASMAALDRLRNFFVRGNVLPLASMALLVVNLAMVTFLYWQSTIPRIDVQVSDSDGAPISELAVQMVIRGGPEPGPPLDVQTMTTNAKGEANFAIPYRFRADHVAEFAVIRGNSFDNEKLRIEKSTRLQLVLEASTPRSSLAYYELDGTSAHLLLMGAMPPALSKLFGENLIIARTAPLEFATRMLDEFSVETWVTEGVSAKSGLKRSDQVVESNLDTKPFIQSLSREALRRVRFREKSTGAYIHVFQNPQGLLWADDAIVDWLSGNGSPPGNLLADYRFAGELRHLPDDRKRFYPPHFFAPVTQLDTAAYPKKYRATMLKLGDAGDMRFASEAAALRKEPAFRLLRKLDSPVGFPPGLIYGRVSTDHAGYVPSLELPEIKLLVVVLANLTNKPIPLGSASFFTSEFSKPASESEALAAFSKSGSAVRQLIPGKLLLSGQKLMIPLGLVLTQLPMDVEGLEGGNENRAKIYSAVERKEVDYFGEERKPPYVRKASDLWPHTELPSKKSAANFRFGPQLQLDSFSLGDTSIKARDFDRSFMVTSFPLSAGSCPFLLVKTGDSPSPRSLGTILRSAAGAEREMTERIPLPANTTQVTILEQEFETSFLRKIAFVARMTNGTEVKHVVYDIAIHAGQPMRLGIGESFTVDLPSTLRNAASVDLEVRGHYVPHHTVKYASPEVAAPVVR